MEYRISAETVNDAFTQISAYWAKLAADRRNQAIDAATKREIGRFEGEAYAYEQVAAFMASAKYHKTSI